MGRIFITVLLFSLNTFAGGAIAGKVTIVKGQVFIIRSGEKIQVKKDTTVLESDVIESQPGGTARITMIDSNLVDVYPKSKVEIAKYIYKPNQDQKDVELKVDFGKIKSTVNQKYDGAKNKFQVKTPSAVAGVRGTVFTAEYDLVRKVSKVVTIEGLVAVTKIIDRERQTPPVFVRPDQVVKVDAEQAKTEQPRDLKSDEREERKKEDKDLGYQYDPKKEPTPGEPPSSRNEPSVPDKNLERPAQDVQAREPIKDQPSSTEEQANRRVKDVPTTVAEDRRAPPIKEIQPVKEIIKEERREQPQALREVIKDTVKNVSERRQERQQERQAEQQEKRQTASEDQQAKKQKQSEDEQAKKQKQLEEEQSRKQKQSEEEQAKKQKQMEEMLAAKRKHAEEAQAKREEEQKKRAEEQQARRAELARRLAEIAKRAETVIRLPSGTTDGSTTPTSPINTLIPKQ